MDMFAGIYPVPVEERMDSDDLIDSILRPTGKAGFEVSKTHLMLQLKLGTDIVCLQVQC